MEPVELHVDSKPEPGHSAVCIELSKHHTLTVTHYTASCADVPNVVATRHTLQRPKSLPAAVTASASWECGATRRMWLNGQVSSNVTILLWLLSKYNCRGLRLPKFKLSQDFGIMHLTPPPEFHHPVFSRLEVIVLTNIQTHPQTNKQIPLKTSNVLCYAMTLGNHCYCFNYLAHLWHGDNDDDDNNDDDTTTTTLASCFDCWSNFLSRSNVKVRWEICGYQSHTKQYLHATFQVGPLSSFSQNECTKTCRRPSSQHIITTLAHMINQEPQHKLRKIHEVQMIRVMAYMDWKDKCAFTDFGHHCLNNV